MQGELFLRYLYFTVCAVSTLVGIFLSWYGVIAAIAAFLVAARLIAWQRLREMRFVQIDMPKGPVVVQKCFRCDQSDDEFLRALLSHPEENPNEPDSQTG
jgi:hypothetical protein